MEKIIGTQLADAGDRRTALHHGSLGPPSNRRHWLLSWRPCESRWRKSSVAPIRQRICNWCASTPAGPPTPARSWWCFPEATMCRFGVPLGPIAEPVDGPWADGVRRIATDSGITVIAGMFTPAGDGRVTNTLIAAGPGTPNQPDTHYDKIHLYDAFGFTESRTVAPGHEPVVITVDGVAGGVDHLLRHSLSGALHRAGPTRRPADRRLRVLGFGARQTRTVDVAGPGPGAGLDELCRRGRPGRPRRQPDRPGVRLGRTDRGGWQPGGVAAG